MGALKLLSFENYISTVDEELSCASFLGEKKLSIVRDFLSANQVLTIKDVTINLVSDFYSMIYRRLDLSDSQRTSYASALETVVRLFYEQDNPHILEELSSIHMEKHVRAKVSFFLLIHHIHQIDEIDARLRISYENYICSTMRSKQNDYIKGMDLAKFHSIEHTQNDFHSKELRYADEILYLAYHPNFEIASSYMKTAVKEPLFFDFSLPASSILKHQIFDELKFTVEDQAGKTNHYRLQTLITPLWDFYKFCYENNISDVLQMSADDIRKCKEYLTSADKPICKTATQVIHRIQKHTFLNANRTDWNANVWFLERFTFAEGRMNPANPTEAFYFDDIKNSANAKLLKIYMKYLLGLSQRLSITSIYNMHTNLKDFFRYCDDADILLFDITKAQIEEYINSLSKREISAAYSNKIIHELGNFITFLETKDFIDPLGFHFEYYKASTTYKHNDISVSKENVNKVFDVLDKFPEHLRLMYLNLWCIGLRLNEVCAIKGDAYLFDGTTAWFLIYQNKARGEKRVPIPYELYSLMTDYITKNHIGTQDYVFPSSKGNEPYRTGTFRKQFNDLLDQYGVSKEYHFRSHGYRHTMATELYMGGSNMQSIREYLGHSDMDMTKQYVDHLPNMIDKANDEYFRRKTL